MHRQRGLHGLGLATANLEAAVKDRALDEQIRRLDGERLKEEDAVQCRTDSSTRHLEVRRAWEDDAALHDVVGHDGVKLACGGRAEDDTAVRRGQSVPRQRVRRVAPREQASTVPEQRHRAAFEIRAPRVRFRAPCQDCPAGRLGAPRAKSERLRRVRGATKGERLAITTASKREHRVRDRAAVPERAHATSQLRRDGLRRQHEAAYTRAQTRAHQRVERAQMCVPRCDICHLAQSQQPHLPGRRLRVADARLRRTNDDGPRILRRAVHRRQCPGLRRIAQRRPRAVRLDASDLKGSKRRALECCYQQRALRRAVGRRQAR